MLRFGGGACAQRSPGRRSPLLPNVRPCGRHGVPGSAACALAGRMSTTANKVGRGRRARYRLPVEIGGGPFAKMSRSRGPGARKDPTRGRLTCASSGSRDRHRFRRGCGRVLSAVATPLCSRSPAGRYVGSSAEGRRGRPPKWRCARGWLPPPPARPAPADGERRVLRLARSSTRAATAPLVGMRLSGLVAL
jgi:hypothetical protein